MKCPRTFTATADNYGNLYINGAHCLQEECAWYRQQAEQCSIYVLAEDIRDLRDTMRDIKDKMPHEQQFRK